VDHGEVQARIGVRGTVVLGRQRKGRILRGRVYLPAACQFSRGCQDFFQLEWFLYQLKLTQGPAAAFTSKPGDQENRNRREFPSNRVSQIQPIHVSGHSNIGHNEIDITLKLLNELQSLGGGFGFHRFKIVAVKKRLEEIPNRLIVVDDQAGLPHRIHYPGVDSKDRTRFLVRLQSVLCPNRNPWQDESAAEGAYNFARNPESRSGAPVYCLSRVDFGYWRTQIGQS